MQSCNLSALLGLLALTLQWAVVQGTPEPVDCTAGSVDGTSQLNSPQFAELCRISGRITEVNNYTAPYIGLTADMVCDADCRCVMGARARGGRCGKRSDGTVYCKCDYGNTTQPALYPVACLDTALPGFKNTICNPEAPGSNITYPIFNDKACNSDCQCSHGYGNTGNHKCTVQNTNTYCVCENGTNIM